VGAKQSLVLWVFALGCVAPATAQDTRIQFAEKVSIRPAAGATEFDVLGRRFAVVLESNERLLAKLPAHRKAALASSRFLRGRLTDVPGSWVRLAAVGGKLQGAIWDGHELYAVATLAEAQPYLTVSLAGEPDDTVIFRYSDTINLLPERFCGTSAGAATPASNGLEQYKSLVGEIGAHAHAAMVLSDQLDVSLIADSTYQDAESGDEAAEMLARLNTADGIYAAQLSLLLNASDVRLAPTNPDPFTATTSASALLGRLSEYRVANPPVQAADLAHLVVARNLDGNVLGVARLDGVCSSADGVSLSVGTLGSWASGLIMAHEIAHNLGAVHDGEGVCAAETSNWLMAPAFNNLGIFSQCSVNTLRTKIDNAACIGTATVADVMTNVSAPVIVERDVPFDIVATLHSEGTISIQGVGVSFTIPGDFIVDAITSSAGTCAPGATPSCTLGDIPAAEQRTATLTVRAQTETNQRTVTALASAANDRAPTNNSAFATIAVVNNADAAISVSPGSATARIDEPVEYTIRVQGLRTRPTRNIRVSNSNPGLRNLTYTPSAGTCTGFGDCTIGDLAPGAVATIIVRGVANNVGSWTDSIRLESFDDTNGNNNFATYRLSIIPAYNLAITGPGGFSAITLGDTHTGLFTVSNTVGIQTVANARVTLFANAWTPLQSASVAGGTCTLESPLRATCSLGSVSVGETRIVTATVLGVRAGSGSLGARVEADRDDQSSDNDAGFGILVRNPVDLRIQGTSWLSRVERRAETGTVNILSESAIAATNFVATVELPPDSHLTSIAMADTTCEIVDPRHGRCTAATLPHQQARELSVGMVGDQPGLKPVRVAIAAATDADTSDNEITINLNILPFTDASVTAPVLPQYLFVGQTYEFETHLRTAYRDVSNVGFSVDYPIGLRLTAPTDLTGCNTRRDVSNLYESLYCLMPLVPANTDRLLRFQLHVESLGNGGRAVWVQAITSPDHDWSNNGFERPVSIVEESDVTVETASASAVATVGSNFTLPRITLRSTRTTLGTVLRIPLPSFATVQGIDSAAGWSCTGTVTIECNVFQLGPDSQTSFDVTLRANSPGSFTSRVEITAGNDNNAANNTRDIAITVNAAPSSSSGGGGGSSSGGGGGGGGSADWLLVALFSLLALVRTPAFGRPLCRIRDSCGLRH
jgi:hypothetical protein